MDEDLEQVLSDQWVSPPKTTSQGAVLDAKDFRPLNERLGLSVEGNEPSSTVIPELLASRCPFAVLGFVMAVVVYSLQSQSLRTLPHICVKVFKSLPSFANKNPSTAVSVVVLVVLVGASLNHIEPSLVGARPRKAVPVVSLQENFSQYTPTTPSGTGPEMRGANHFFYAAITQNPEADVRISTNSNVMRCLTSNQKFSETFTNQVEFLHG